MVALSRLGSDSEKTYERGEKVSYPPYKSAQRSRGKVSARAPSTVFGRERQFKSIYCFAGKYRLAFATLGKMFRLSQVHVSPQNKEASG